ncbi:MAG: DUF2752 domain-containing protein [Verrucomicrobiales bacterium]|nr:DUF2752 domain-containing protein [Verrucomicrobiales bacterium]
MTVAMSKRHPEVLIAPAVTLIAVALMLVVAHFYERLPARFPECGFYNRTGIPCLACGGTRSMQALAHGKVISALQFHPAFTLGVLATPLWLAFGIRRFRRRFPMLPSAEQNRRVKVGIFVFSGILVANWIYLVFTLP